MAVFLCGFVQRGHGLLSKPLGRSTRSFGSYRINERKDAPLRVSLQFAQSEEQNLYSWSVRPISAALAEDDGRLDVLSDQWDPALARKQ